VCFNLPIVRKHVYNYNHLFKADDHIHVGGCEHMYTVLYSTVYSIYGREYRMRRSGRRLL
jgi:hypothetical protein